MGKEENTDTLVYDVTVYNDIHRTSTSFKSASLDFLIDSLSQLDKTIRKK
jgi:hypothetical protein